MNHPTTEEWMAYLYKEVEPAERAVMKAHLDQCAECRSNMTEWQGAMSNLNTWKLPATPVRRWSQPVLKWGIAAALVLGLGFAAGRSQANGAANDVAELKAQVANESARRDEEIRQLKQTLTESIALVHEQSLAAFKTQLQMNNEKILAAANEKITNVMTGFVRIYDENRSADQATIANAFSQVEARRAEEMRQFREELETVAILTEASFQKAQNQLVQIAAATGISSSNQ